MNKRQTLILCLIVFISIILIATFNKIKENRQKKEFMNDAQNLINVVKLDYENREGKIIYSYKNNKLICKRCENGKDFEIQYTDEFEAVGKIENNNGKIKLSISNESFIAVYVNNKIKVIKKLS